MGLAYHSLELYRINGSKDKLYLSTDDLFGEYLAVVLEQKLPRSNSNSKFSEEADSDFPFLTDHHHHNYTQLLGFSEIETTKRFFNITRYISLRNKKTGSFLPFKIWSFAAMTSIAMLSGVFLLVFIGKLRGMRNNVNVLEWNILIAAMIYQCLPFVHNGDHSTAIYSFLLQLENYTKILFRILMALRIFYFISAINSYTLSYWDRRRLDDIFDNGKTVAYVDVSEERKEEMRNIIEVISASDKQRALRIMTLLEIIDEKLQRHIKVQIEKKETLDREIEGEEETTFSNLSSLRHRPIIPFVEQ
ncbi:Oidioi.mRNA.OKI2018_I69.chr2.g7938.t1.cds [Oikopleura dioica]|uniref:Oidioi.mRNA.OKI2018_I69.chr2.g7938.t1.cds n=1 Tax=Oikopleura dioica TaxID=34765 RepID=A0ABN7TE30_OIKDI|nr:Oidioi.mRNA.OKI2018_I69.chr2.g7938.t1.cds [Oikopleura dioica]